MVFAQSIPSRILGTQPLVLPVSGWLTGSSGEAERVLVEVDGKACGQLRMDEPLPPRLRPEIVVELPDRARGFAGEIPLDSRPLGFEHSIKLTTVSGNHDAWQVEVQSVSRLPVESVSIGDQDRPPKVAICMAVFNPDAEAFRTQIRSIVEQAFDDWICIVNDDFSDESHQEIIRDTIAMDRRFHYFRNDGNVGFYANFETALARVPEGVEYVALADQDDRWYPDKLGCLVDELEKGARLVYSDMRIVSEHGEVLAQSYWAYRKNSWQDLPLMLIANTVTGAACMMRRDLVDRLLPFPPKIGDAFHDHWIACAALSGGRIDYVDRPLYDYVQYGSSVIGHCGFDDAGARQTKSGRSRWRYLNPLNWRSFLGRVTGAGLAVYWHECRRIEAICGNILARGVDDRGKRAILAGYGRGFRTAWTLLKLRFVYRDIARYTNNAERRLAQGYLVHEVLKRVNRVR
jgi:glycosyltransferase involved in cell wall biosynthesis